MNMNFEEQLEYLNFISESRERALTQSSPTCVPCAFFTLSTAN